MKSANATIIPFPAASSSARAPHTLGAGGSAMTITNRHPEYASAKERTQRLADLKALCREKLSASRKADEKAS